MLQRTRLGSCRRISLRRCLEARSSGTWVLAAAYVDRGSQAALSKLATCISRLVDEGFADEVLIGGPLAEELLRKVYRICSTAKNIYSCITSSKPMKRQAEKGRVALPVALLGEEAVKQALELVDLGLKASYGRGAFLWAAAAAADEGYVLVVEPSPCQDMRIYAALSAMASHGVCEVLRITAHHTLNSTGGSLYYGCPVDNALLEPLARASTRFSKHLGDLLNASMPSYTPMAVSSKLLEKTQLPNGTLVEPFILATASKDHCMLGELSVPAAVKEEITPSHAQRGARELKLLLHEYLDEEGYERVAESYERYALGAIRRAEKNFPKASDSHRGLELGKDLLLKAVALAKRVLRTGYGRVRLLPEVSRIARITGRTSLREEVRRVAYISTIAALKP